MNRLLLTCTLAALSTTALAQTPPANQPANPPAAAQPAQPSTTAPASPGTAQKPGTDMQAKPGAQTQPPVPNRSTAAQPAGEVRVVFYAVKPADVRASSLIGSTVYNVNNENIGEINDVILSEGKSLQAVVIGVGGFLGMGEHNVAVEPNSLSIMPDGDDPDDFKVVLNTTKDDLKNAPAVKFDKDSRREAASGTPPATTTGAGTPPATNAPPMKNNTQNK
jgi:hypothetical protein